MQCDCGCPVDYQEPSDWRLRFQVLGQEFRCRLLLKLDAPLASVLGVAVRMMLVVRKEQP